MAELRWGATTDSGRIRPGNEDNLLADRRVFVVADGMGGHQAGEVASALAVDLLRSRLSAAGATLDDVVGAVADANDDIYRAANGNPDQQGMGTTLTALVVVDAIAPLDDLDDVDDLDDAGDDGGDGGDPTQPIPVDSDQPDAPAGGEDRASDEPHAAPEVAGDDEPAVQHGSARGEADELEGERPANDDGPQHEQFALINVGDSRTYLLRHDRLRRITTDHSYVQELVATGHITDDEARSHPRRNIVTRALGIDPAVRVDAWTLPIVSGDRFVLCSDGLVDEVRDDDIAELLRSHPDAQEAADALVEEANRQGGRDNITVVVVDVLEGEPPPAADTELDLEPAWQDGTGQGTWTVDDPDGQATEFADLAALVGGQSPQDAEAQLADGRIATREPTTDELPVVDGDGAPRRTRRRAAGFFVGLGLLAVVILGFVFAAAWARRGYYVAFDAAENVAIYRGRPEGFLWFEPTEDAATLFSRSSLDAASVERVDGEPRFDSFRSAERFVAEQLETTTTSTTTTTTAPTTTTTTTAPTTTTVPPTTAPVTTAAAASTAAP